MKDAKPRRSNPRGGTGSRNGTGSSRGGAGAAPGPRIPPSRRAKSPLREWVEVIVVGLLVVSLFRGVVAQAYQIPSGSMEKTLLVGDFLFINKMVYGAELAPGFQGRTLFDFRFPAIRKPRPGDIIVFRYPLNTAVDYIKRCVAVEGQTVEVRDKVLYVDGERRDEPYAIHGDPRILPRGEKGSRDNFGPITVPKDCLFMMGDNRDNSFDSRFWGPLPLRLVKGKAMFLYLSWDGARMLPRFERFFRGLH
jgi:signal peptidase I